MSLKMKVIRVGDEVIVESRAGCIVDGKIYTVATVARSQVRINNPSCAQCWWQVRYLKLVSTGCEVLPITSKEARNAVPLPDPAEVISFFSEQRRQ